MRHLLFILLCLSTYRTLVAQQTFVVDAQHAKASDAHSGSQDAPFKTINHAAQVAQAGDTILVKGGTYRERIAPARGGEAGKPIVYMAAPGERVRVTATERWQPEWQPVQGTAAVFYGSFSAVDFSLKLPPAVAEAFPQRPTTYFPHLDTLDATPTGQVLSLGQVFVEGVPLLEVDDSLTLLRRPGSWMLDESRKGAYVHFPASNLTPSERLVEITTRQRCFAPYTRGLGYIEVHGFLFEGGATNFPKSFWREDGNPQAGIVSTRGGHHWRIQGCTIRYGKSIGLDLGNEGGKDADGLGQPRPANAGYHLILGNTLSDNGCGGIEGIGSTATRIIGNRIERNNRLGFTAPEIGGIKLHVFEDGLIADNLIQDNYGYGLWLDNVWRNSRVTRNVLIGNQGTNLFIELGNGPLLVDNNVIALSHNGLGLNGDGVYSHDASGVTFAHNLIFGSANFGLWVHVATDRKRYTAQQGLETETRIPCEASNWRIYQNLFWNNYGGTLALPAVSDRSTGNRSDYNHFAGPYDLLTSETFSQQMAPPWFRILPNKGRIPIDSLYTALYQQINQPPRPVPNFSLEEWHGLTGWDTHSVYGLVLRPVMRQSILQFSCLVSSDIQGMSPAPLQGFDTDFLQQPYDESPLPGPFQHLQVLPEALTQQPVPFRGPYGHVRGEAFPENLIYLGQWPKIYPFGHTPQEQGYFNSSPK